MTGDASETKSARTQKKQHFLKKCVRVMRVQCDTKIATDWHIYGPSLGMKRPKCNNILSEEYRCAWGCRLYSCRYSCQMTVECCLLLTLKRLFYLKPSAHFLPTCALLFGRPLQRMPLVHAVSASQKLARGWCLTHTIISLSLLTNARYSG